MTRKQFQFTFHDLCIFQLRGYGAFIAMHRDQHRRLTAQNGAARSIRYPVNMQTLVGDSGRSYRNVWDLLAIERKPEADAELRQIIDVNGTSTNLPGNSDTRE